MIAHKFGTMALMMKLCSALFMSTRATDTNSESNSTATAVAQNVM